MPTSTQEFQSIVTWISGLSGAPALAFILLAMWKRWLVFGNTYDELRRDRDEWKGMALRYMQYAAHSAETTQKAVDVAAVAATALPSTPSEIR